MLLEKQVLSASDGPKRSKRIKGLPSETTSMWIELGRWVITLNFKLETNVCTSIQTVQTQNTSISLTLDYISYTRMRIAHMCVLHTLLSAMYPFIYY